MIEVFPSIRSVKTKFKRARTVKSFILADDCKDKINCTKCGKSLFDYSGKDERNEEKHPVGYRSNRCVYHPTTKTVTGAHYVCSWENTIDRALTTYLR